MASVSFSGVRKSYAAHPVIKGVTLDIADGEFVVLVGPSGCGKSTLLRMVAGLESITGGEIAIGSNVVNDVMPKDRDIAMVFQTYALYPHMTVAENMGFSLRLAGVAKTEIDQRVKKAAGILALEPLLDRLPKQLSGGQRQRVAMGRAIVRDPKVFLFDEPLSNLDAKLRVKMRAEVKELHQRLRTTTIYVTHDQIEAMTMADRVVVMRDGIVEQVGTPLELYDRPASLFVASFIGSPAMNFLNGRIDEDETGISFQADNGFRLQVLPRRIDATVGETIFGIRPEHLELTDPAAPGAIRAKIVVVEPTGAETVVIARAGGDEITAVVRGRSAVRPGEDIGLRPMPEHVHFFLGDGSGSAPR